MEGVAACDSAGRTCQAAKKMAKKMGNPGRQGEERAKWRIYWTDHELCGIM